MLRLTTVASPMPGWAVACAGTAGAVVSIVGLVQGIADRSILTAAYSMIGAMAILSWLMFRRGSVEAANVADRMIVPTMVLLLAAIGGVP